MSSASRSARGQLPARIGPYRIDGEISAGGMGVVYRATGPDGGAVALKTVQLESESMLSGIRREIRALRSLEHPGVVGIVDDGTFEGLPYYVMELLDGPTLRQLHRARTMTPSPLEEPGSGERPRGTPADVESDRGEIESSRGRANDPELTRDLLSAIVTVARTLSFLHGRGIVHRDLKPDNVILTPSRGPVIVDFGIAVRSVGADMRESIEAGGRVLGSPAYMAPEQIRGELVDARADLYAVGCMLFEAITGRLPFEGEGARAVLSRKLGGDPPPLRALAPDAPLELDRLVQRLLAREPEARIGHADDVVAVLLAFGARDEGQRGPAADPYLYRPRLAGRSGAMDRARLVLEAAARPRPIQLTPPSKRAPDEADAGEEERASSPHESGLYDGDRAARSLLETSLDDSLPGHPTIAPTLDVSTGRGGVRRQGGYLFIGGESGVGKTRLAMELSALAARKGFSVVTGQCVRVETDAEDTSGLRAAPLHPFASVLVAIADACRGEPALYDELLGPRGPVLAPFEPNIAALDRCRESPPLDPIPAEAARARVHEALSATLGAYARRSPLLLVLDDAQWADEHSLAFLRSLDARWFDDTGAVIIVTHRLEEAQPALDTLIAAHPDAALRLERLDRGAIVEVARDMLAAPEVDEGLVSFLADNSEGNPFFLAEYLRAAVAERLLVRDALGRWRWSPGGERDRAALPRALFDVISLRLSGLGDAARRCVRMLAVLGREASGLVLDRALGSERVLESEEVAELVRRHVIEEHPPGSIRFLHDKLREVVYAQLSDSERRAFHRAAGDALVAWTEGQPGERERITPELANHFAEGGDVHRACHYLERAGLAAMADGSYRDAVRFFERAAELTRDRREEPDERIRVAGWVRQAAIAYHALGDLKLAEARGREALRLATGGSTLLDLPLESDRAARARFLGKTLAEVGVQLFGLFDRLAPRAGVDDVAHREAALAAEKLAETYLFLNDQTRAAVSTLLAGNHAQALGPSPELARACSLLALAASFVPAHRLGRLYAERAVKIARMLRDPRTDLDVEFMRGFWIAGLADGREAIACFGRSLALSRDLSDRRREEENLALLGMIEAIHARHAEALDHFGELEALATRSQNEQSRFWAATGRSQVWSRLGRTNATIEDYDRLQPYIQRSSDVGEKVQLVVPAMIYVKKGRLDQAARLLDDYLVLTRTNPPAGCHLFWSYASACDTAKALHDARYEPTRSLSRLREAHARMVEFAQVFTLGRAEAARSEAELIARTGGGRRVRARLLTAIEEARAFDLPIEEAKAHAGLRLHGSSLAERQRHGELAREIFTRFGTWGLLADLDAL